MMFRTLRISRTLLLALATLLVVLIALADWFDSDNIPLGFLYLVPMILFGRVLRPWLTVASAALCTLFAELFDPFAWNLRTGIPRDTLYFAAFVTIGIFVYTANRNRTTTLAQMQEIERLSNARHEAEQQLHVLIESSPAAILTTDSEGRVLTANEAAHRMLGLPAGSLAGRQIQPFFPALSSISRDAYSTRVFRAVMQSRGRREDGETFMAEVCFSTYITKAGARLAAMILDASEELRTHEEASLHQMLAGSRIAVSAVSHEIRNVCGAIGVVHHNLARNQVLWGNKDFEALGNLVLALEKIASVDLLQYPDDRTEVDLASALDDLRIIIGPSLQEHGIEGAWRVEANLPPIWADRTNLMQIFLNLTNNSLRALRAAEASAPIFTLTARRTGPTIAVEVIDNAGGVAQPDQLFHPFQAGAQATGLGLYLSRAFARSFGGDLRYEPLAGHARFTVELPIVANAGVSA